MKYYQTGVQCHRADATCAGLTLIAPMRHEAAHLIDLQGQVVDTLDAVNRHCNDVNTKGPRCLQYFLVGKRTTIGCEKWFRKKTRLSESGNICKIVYLRNKLLANIWISDLSLNPAIDFIEPRFDVNNETQPWNLARQTDQVCQSARWRTVRECCHRGCREFRRRNVAIIFVEADDMAIPRQGEVDLYHLKSPRDHLTERQP